ncbi:halimadienyl-diphosphate synthase [Labedaea rhizosphaerae]|uniref:Halimadienyl-diphosphate synthase n=1 Tax=Labedaea rhizosphaerae TaxID=598644 RepID=A0A4R6SD66_LABRH|nr:halimadienyl-diphosphate synthase [Labedaea rhizosphaerae]
MHGVTERVSRLLADLTRSTVASTAYATAWAARLTGDDGKPVFPQARPWLADHQHADGSWGGSVPNPYDRLVCTLAAVLALREIDEPWASSAVRSGVDYLHKHATDWRGAPGEVVGFELAAPYLAEQASKAGLLSLDGFADLVALRADKLARVPAGALTREPTTLLYSLEVLGDLVQPRDVVGFAGPNGSMSNNPPATAALWAATGAPTALEYLRSAAQSTGDGGMPEIFPISVTEPAWAIYLLHRAGLTTDEAKPHVDRLLALADGAEFGLGTSAEFPVPDSDDTAMVANVVHAFGHDDTALLESLLHYEKDDHFIGFPYERGTPVTANARIAEALSRRPDRFASQIKKAITFLMDSRHDGAWWDDKWHLSPYYATAQVVFGLAGSTPPDTLSATRKWLLDGQHPDGSWGMAGGQPEETAYAVLSLDAMGDQHGPVPADTMRRAADYLGEHLDDPSYAELWMSKGLYIPVAPARAAVLSAYAVSRGQP